MKNLLSLINRAIFSGILIAIAGVAYLSSPNALGAILFNFGLISVICFNVPLYTGYAGFVDYKSIKDWRDLILILFGNVLGTSIVGALIVYGKPDLIASTANVINSRLDLNALELLICGMFCGILMTIAVKFAKHDIFSYGNKPKNWLPLVFAIPLFILSGFCHSIADAFYISVVSISGVIQPTSFAYMTIFCTWLWVVLGNFIGCNLPRLFVDVFDGDL